MKNVKIYSDGACSGNPGKGGFGTILVHSDSEKCISKGYKNTTNNRMELMGVISGLECIKYPCNIEIISDSKYVVDAINKGWIDNWQKNNWKKSDKKPVLNIDLWQKLLELMRGHEVKFTWVEGHNGHEYNERCDKMAVMAYCGQALELDVGYIV